MGAPSHQLNEPFTLTAGKYLSLEPCQWKSTGILMFQSSMGSKNLEEGRVTIDFW